MRLVQVVAAAQGFAATKMPQLPVPRGTLMEGGALATSRTVSFLSGLCAPRARFLQPTNSLLMGALGYDLGQSHPAVGKARCFLGFQFHPYSTLVGYPEPLTPFYKSTARKLSPSPMGNHDNFPAWASWRKGHAGCPCPQQGCCCAHLLGAALLCPWPFHSFSFPPPFPNVPLG